MPMFMISGIVFTATMIPQKYHYLFDWNPIFHIIELIRQAMFVSYTSPIGDWQYVAFCALVANAAGLMLYQVSRQRFITS
jgi:capsular polysaccharide transport system permease protein